MRRLQPFKLRHVMGKPVHRRELRRPRKDDEHGPASYMTRRLSAKRYTYTSTLRKGHRLPIPWHPTGWRIGMRLFFKPLAYKAVQVSPNPKGALLQGRLQSSRIRSVYVSAIAIRQCASRASKPCLPTTAISDQASTASASDAAMASASNILKESDEI